MKSVKNGIQEVTFQVDDVEIGKRLFREADYKMALEWALKTPIEAWPIRTHKLVPAALSKMHGFLHTLNYAFNEHRPIIISPDMIWLLIAQGFAKHILLDVEGHRDAFVDHEGQELLRVEIKDFVKGRNNHWERVLPVFSEKMQEKVKGDIITALVPSFSTSTPVTKAAFELTLMKSMSGFFKYEVFSRCGIPSITLEGSQADWDKVIAHAKSLSSYGLSWWIDALMPILHQIRETANNTIDRAFWQSIYKFEAMSGGDTISGWITRFFPYLEKDFQGDINSFYLGGGLPILKRETIDENEGLHCATYRNPHLNQALEKLEYASDSFPSSITKTPFKWDDREGTSGEIYDMEFISGFVGAIQNHETLALKPEISWAVRESAI